MNITHHLDNDPWFTHLSAEIQTQLAHSAVLKTYQKNQMIHAVGDNDDAALHLVLGGTIRVCNVSASGNAMTLTHLSSGDWFGEISIIDDNPRTHDAWTTNKVTLLSIPRKSVIHTAEQHPILYKHLALITCGRIRRAFDWIDNATSLNTSARLASMLIGLIGTYGKQVGADIKIDLRLSQEELGFMLGTTRQTINKIIQSWQKQTIINMHYGFITIKNKPQLMAMMNPE
ncbi:Crp/Fnr family transcriptional regulator [Psychrobacter sp. T6-6]|uniref:Crp/Fnr family transcriptional regulator n=1 Tax=Psychrobacter sp. T6-6 TaxID=3457452 RepID=UPI003FD4BC04